MRIVFYNYSNICYIITLQYDNIHYLLSLDHLFFFLTYIDYKDLLLVSLINSLDPSLTYTLYLDIYGSFSNHYYVLLT